MWWCLGNQDRVKRLRWLRTIRSQASKSMIAFLATIIDGQEEGSTTKRRRANIFDYNFQILSAQDIVYSQSRD
jgi:hypothetical protein